MQMIHHKARLPHFDERPLCLLLHNTIHASLVRKLHQTEGTKHFSQNQELCQYCYWTFIKGDDQEIQIRNPFSQRCIFSSLWMLVLVRNIDAHFSERSTTWISQKWALHSNFQNTPTHLIKKTGLVCLGKGKKNGHHTVGQLAQLDSLPFSLLNNIVRPPASSVCFFALGGQTLVGRLEGLLIRQAQGCAPNF